MGQRHVVTVHFTQVSTEETPVAGNKVSFAFHLSQLDELTKLVKFPRYLGWFCIFPTEHRVETSYV